MGQRNTNGGSVSNSDKTANRRVRTVLGGR